MLLPICFLVTILGWADSVTADVHVANPDNYVSVVTATHSGDTVRLSPGVYRHGLRLHGLIGRPDAPIVIEGPPRGEPALFPASPGHNTVSIVNSAYVVIRNLVLDGQNLPVDGVKCEGYTEFAHHITLEGLTIRGHGNNQQTVGISTKCPAWNWVIRGNVIEGAGTGVYLGNSDAGDPFVAGLIEGNLIVDSVGYDLQIKHQAPWPVVEGMPTGTTETVIRRNVFAKTVPLRADAEPRPNVLVGHWPRIGPGKDDRYLVYGNLFYGNPAESLFQGEGNIALYNNVFVAPDRDAIRIQPHNDIPKDIVVAYNTVLAREAGIVLIPGQGSEAYRQVISHNVIFATRPLAGSAAGMNVLGQLDDAARYLMTPKLVLDGLDLRPKPALLRLRSSIQVEKSLPGIDRDFDGLRRDPDVAGAYTATRGSLKWIPKLERILP